MDGSNRMGLLFPRCKDELGVRKERRVISSGNEGSLDRRVSILRWRSAKSTVRSVARRNVRVRFASDGSVC